MFKVVGFRQIDFTGSDGRPVSGTKMYLSEKRDGVTGVATEAVFISTNKIGTYIPMLGDDVQLFYNKYGKVDAITLMKRNDVK